MSRHSARSRKYQQERERILSTHPLCWICGIREADEIDHVIPASVAPHLREDPRNMRPACAICNRRRGNRPPPTRAKRPSRDWY